jgi:hypothetical protein
MPAKNDSFLKRLGGRLHKIIPLVDAEGEVVHYHTIPLRLEMTSRDVMQVIAGAALLSIPVAFTEEAWTNWPMRWSSTAAGGMQFRAPRASLNSNSCAATWMAAALH